MLIQLPNAFGEAVTNMAIDAALLETIPEGLADFQAQLLARIAQVLDLKTGQIGDIRPLFDSNRIEREKERFASQAWNQRR